MDRAFIDVNNIGFRYPDGTEVLTGMNLSIKKGEFIGILGANGAGKTTFLKILNRLLKPTQGRIYLSGKDIMQITKDHFFSRVCTVFQNPDDQLFAATVKEDVAFGPSNMGITGQKLEERICSALDAVSMIASSDKPVHNLSFGQKKRVCLAGVLAMAPEVMLLDEPASGLDPIGVSSIMQLLRGLNREKGLTMLMATHSVDLIPLFTDRVVVLHQGRILSEGTPAEVFSNPGLLRSASLRLPRIGHLFEILKSKDDISLDNIPLTIGEARSTIKKRLI